MIKQSLSEIELVAYTARLLSIAFDRHHTTDITPPVTFPRFRDAVTVYGDKIMLWYNTVDHSTHIVSITLSQNT